MSNPVSCGYSIAGEGPPLFLIHGIGASRHTWDGLVEYLKKDFQCISYDLRGHGESPVPSVPYSLDDLVADLERLREHLQLDSAHFAGHSLGGMIAPAYARIFPARVRSLGLISTAAGRSEDDRNRVITLVEEMEKGGVEHMLDRLVDRWFTPGFATCHSDVVENRRRQVLATDEDVFLSVFRLYAETEMRPWLSEVKSPSLVVTGELDGGCSPRLNEIIADELPHSELEILDGLRHNILLEAPQRVAQSMRRFLHKHQEAET